MCGEKVTVNFFNFYRLGSPPRVRGKVDDAETGDLIHRITPACAGKSVKSPLDKFKLEDHPRVCGEKPGQTTG